MTRPMALISAMFLAASPVAGADGAATALETWQAEPATVFDARDIDIADFKWTARPIVVFADAEEVPAFQSQLDLLQADLTALAERDVVLVVDTNPAERSVLRTKLRPRGFMLVLIGKDGGVKLRKPFPWDVRELSRQIDKMPMRQQEIRDALETE